MPPAKKKQYVYVIDRVHSTDAECTAECLADRANDGWEMVTALENSHSGVTRYIWRRIEKV